MTATDFDLQVVRGLLDELDSAVPCSYEDCDDPATYRWVLRHCGCVHLVCTDHARRLLDMVIENAGNLCAGRCEMCDTWFHGWLFEELFIIEPLRGV